MKKTTLMSMIGLALLGPEAYLTNLYEDRSIGCNYRQKKLTYKTGSNQRKKRKLNHWANKKVN